MSLISIRPHSSAHSGGSSTQCPTLSSRLHGGDWRCRPGRPRSRWTDQLRNDTGSVSANLWRQAILRGMVERRDGPELATQWQWRRWCTVILLKISVKCRIFYRVQCKPQRHIISLSTGHHDICHLSRLTQQRVNNNACCMQCNFTVLHNI